MYSYACVLFACRALTSSMDWMQKVYVFTCVHDMCVCVKVFVYVCIFCVQGRDIEHGLKVSYIYMNMYTCIYVCLCICICICMHCGRAGR